ncbi:MULTISPECIES: hypothetical protein [Actinomadura]|uniref:Uncharacterized protein n=1 Tax=Actinomadura yumaensis TaxID=111807 RepID=A0ABW2CIK1_9ACTN|nr:hypothetical protein [Actinomadura sp. J1-007]MWK37196.1 hypothetical protein [Actinomadura sp. J1-007]
MSSRFSPGRAPIGDVGAALLLIDSRIKGFQSERPEMDPEQHRLIDQFLRSFDSEGANDVLDGACTLIYLYVEWLRQAHEHLERDVIEYVLPYVVGTMRMMTRSIEPETIPTMAGMMVAAAIGVSPTLWRRQYGPWLRAELIALEATVFLLADHINHITEDPDAATRLITDLLNAVTEDLPPL